jgi:putative peptidoglycan lipid II flippase
MILVTQLAGIVQSQVATSAGENDPSVAILRFSWLIFMLPHSIVTVSIATAYFTRVSGNARDGRTDKVRADVSTSLRSILLVIVFATAALMVVAYPFAAVFGGTFAAVSAMGNVLIAFLAGLIPFSILFVMQRTFFALEDTRTPFFIQVFQSTLFVIGALAVASLPTAWIAFGIAAVTTSAGTAQAILAAVILRRRLGGFDAARIVRQLVRFVVAAVPSAIVGFGIVVLLGGTTDGGFAVSSPIAGAVTIAAVGLVMALVYAGGLAILRVEEFHEARRIVTDRFRRG